MNRPYRQSLLNKQMGFIVEKEELDNLIKEDRLQSVLVRCGSGRFMCPAQDVDIFANIINKEGTTYVRDLSVTSDGW